MQTTSLEKSIPALSALTGFTLPLQGESIRAGGGGQREQPCLTASCGRSRRPFTLWPVSQLDALGGQVFGDISVARRFLEDLCF